MSSSNTPFWQEALYWLLKHLKPLPRRKQQFSSADGEPDDGLLSPFELAAAWQPSHSPPVPPPSPQREPNPILPSPPMPPIEYWREERVTLSLQQVNFSSSSHDDHQQQQKTTTTTEPVLPLAVFAPMSFPPVMGRPLIQIEKVYPCSAPIVLALKEAVGCFLGEAEQFPTFLLVAPITLARYRREVWQESRHQTHYHYRVHTEGMPDDRDYYQCLPLYSRSDLGGDVIQCVFQVDLEQQSPLIEEGVYL